jgi:hypothetical protein
MSTITFLASDSPHHISRNLPQEVNGMSTKLQTYHVCVHGQYAKTWLPIPAAGAQAAVQAASGIARVHAPLRVTLHADPYARPTHSWNWAPK